MSRTNVLSMEPRTSPRRPLIVVAEFIIDGRPLLEHIERASGQKFDFVSPLGWTRPNHQLEVGERLLLRRPALLPTGRKEFLVCPECADLGCGCISANVHLEEGHYIWSDFGYENDYDPNSLHLFPMGKFVITQEDLNRLLGRHVPGLTRSAGQR